MKTRVFALHVQVQQLNYIPQPALQSSLDRELQGGSQLWAVRGKNHLEQAAAKVWAVDSLTGIGEEKLLDHVPDVFVVIRARGPTAAIEPVRKIDIHRDLILR
jgi:hypothetical protein